MLSNLIWYYKILKKITNNKNQAFISSYEKMLILLLKMRLRFFLICYFEIDK